MRLIYIVLGWSFGIIAARHLTVMSSGNWLVLASVFALALLAVRRSRYRLLLIALLAVTLGALRYELVPQTSAVAQYNGTGGLTLTGVIAADPDVRDERTQFRLDVETVTRGAAVTPSSGAVLVRAPRAVDVRYGDRVAVTGLLTTPGEFDTFSYADYLGRQGVFSVMRDTAVEVVSRGHGSPLSSALFDLRRSVKAAIERHLPEPQAGLLVGILLGNERGISPTLDDAFSRVGASHVIAISGFNMAIIAGVVIGVLERLTTRRGLQIGLALLVITLYTLFTGANAAVVRAAVMSGLLIVGRGLDRETYVPTSLAFAALLMSLLNPTVLWDISFQLSFFATLGLALYADPLSRGFDQLLERTLPRGTARTVSGLLNEPLIVTLAALVFTLPLIVLYFERLSLLVLPVNLLIVPVQAALLFTGGAAVLLSWLPPLAQMIYWLCMVLLSWTIGVVRAFAALPFAEVEVRVNTDAIALYFVGLVGLALLQATQPSVWLRLVRFARRRVVLTTVVLSGIGLTLLLGAVALSRPDGRLHVWLLDVGHSHGTLIETPGGAHILIDGGRFPSRLLTHIGDRLPFTDRQIEVLAISQPDENDVGALTAVLARYEPGVVLLNGQPNQSPAWAELEAALAPHDVIEARAGYTIEMDDGVLLEVLHPQVTPDLAARLDDHPLVLRLTYGEASFLLPGDLSAAGQAELLDAGVWPLATVMQLPAHGTARSLDAEFLAAVQPQAIVVQSDPANRRGDPDPDVLAMLPEQTPLLRTDTGGTIHLWTDGTELWAAQPN